MITMVPAVFLAAQLVISVAAGDSVPRLNVTPSCRATANGAAGLKQDMDVCIKGEESARADVVKQWNNFAPADRSTCTQLANTGGGATYTELITCLEMLRDARKLPKEDTVDMRGVTR